MIQLLKSALLELESGDRAAVHLVWAIGEAQGAHLDPGVGEEKVLADPCASVCLNRTVDDSQAGVGYEDLDSCNVIARAFGPDFVNQMGTLQHPANKTRYNTTRIK
mgnify:FL=1